MNIESFESKLAPVLETIVYSLLYAKLFISGARNDSVDSLTITTTKYFTLDSINNLISQTA